MSQNVHTHSNAINHAVVRLLVVTVDDLDATGGARPHDWLEGGVVLELGEMLGKNVHIRNHPVDEGVPVGGHLVGGVEEGLNRVQNGKLRISPDILHNLHIVGRGVHAR